MAACYPSTSFLTQFPTSWHFRYGCTTSLTSVPDREDNLHSYGSQHYATALPLFGSAMTNVNVLNCHACSAFSALTVIYKWASSDGQGNLFFDGTADKSNSDTVGWAQLLRGSGNLIAHYYQDLKQGPLALMFQCDKVAEQAAASNPAEPAKFSDLEKLWEERVVPFSPIELDALKETFRQLKIKYTMVSTPHDKTDSVSLVMSWPIEIPELFLVMVSRRQPESLVLLAHFCLLLNKVDNFWWIRGLSRRLLQDIHQTLGKEWESWIGWPLQDLVLCEFRKSQPGNEGPVGPAEVI